MRKHAVAVQVGSLDYCLFGYFFTVDTEEKLPLFFFLIVVLFLIPKKVDGTDSLMTIPVVAGIGAEVASNDPG